MWKRFQNRHNPLRGQTFHAAFDDVNRLTDDAMSELGGKIVNGVFEPRKAPVVTPVTRRMHGAELRPSLMNTWNKVHAAEHDMLTQESAAVSQGVIEMLAYLAGHLSSPEAQDHVSVADLLGRTGLDSEVAHRIGLAHLVANPEDPNAPTL
jgi:hypothetical protein